MLGLQLVDEGLSLGDETAAKKRGVVTLEEIIAAEDQNLFWDLGGSEGGDFGGG